MKNTKDACVIFLNKWAIETHPDDDERFFWLSKFSHDDYLDLCVAYAASVRPEVVLPSEHTTQEYVFDFDNGKEYGHNECLSEIKRLNPNVNFVESK